MAKYRNNHVKASEEEIAKALQGNGREEYLFALKQAVAWYDVYNVQLTEGDRSWKKCSRILPATI